MGSQQNVVEGRLPGSLGVSHTANGTGVRGLTPGRVYFKLGTNKYILRLCMNRKITKNWRFNTANIRRKKLPLYKFNAIYYIDLRTSHIALSALLLQND